MPTCPLCEGSGLQITTSKSGDRFAHECTCQLDLRIQRKLDRSGVPPRFRGKTLDTFKVEGKHASLYFARETARRFVDNYPYAVQGKGLVFVGSSGLGKTHLAAAMLGSLILEKQVRGLFFDYQELLKLIQNSYNPAVAATEAALLQPVFDAEILVLDDLGSTRPTPWVWDTVFHILNSRYNRDRSTIITTNFENKPPARFDDPSQATAPDDPGGRAHPSSARETLGDRIGERMRSRLHEMCDFLTLEGADRRQSEQRFRFTPL